MLMRTHTYMALTTEEANFLYTILYYIYIVI